MAGLSVAALLTFAVSANAQSVQNGGFELNTGTGQLGFNTNASDWSYSGYNFLFQSGSADTTGAVSASGAPCDGANCNLMLWGPNNGSNNGLPASSPAGGAFVASDPVFDDGPISQTISGLVAGKEYAVSFYFGAAQQWGFTGNFSAGWDVSLGGQSESTASLAVGSEGFSGWQATALTFTATSASEVLSFLSDGGSGAPPFALLDGVTLTAVPEPGAWVLLLSAVGLTGLSRLRSTKWLKR